MHFVAQARMDNNKRTQHSLNGIKSDENFIDYRCKWFGISIGQPFASGSPAGSVAKGQSSSRGFLWLISNGGTPMRIAALMSAEAPYGQKQPPPIPLTGRPISGGAGSDHNLPSIQDQCMARKCIFLKKSSNKNSFSGLEVLTREKRLPISNCVFLMQIKD